MLLDVKQMKAIVDLLGEEHYAPAIELWQDLQVTAASCNSCFYESLDEAVRCAVCLESHLTNAILGFFYPSIIQDDMELAEQSIKAWLHDHKT